MASSSLLLLSRCRYFLLKQNIHRSFLNQKALLTTSPVIYQKEIFLENEQSSSAQPKRRFRFYIFSTAAGALIGTIYALGHVRKHDGISPEYIVNSDLLDRQAMEKRPVPPPVTKHVTFNRSPLKEFPYKLTLYQYITCPFCCKIRAYLNYNRIPYDVVEVSSVLGREVKWSNYQKVPIVVVENEQIQLNDSNLIMSAIESYFRIPTKTFKDIARLYQPVIEQDKGGNVAFNYPSKYFLTEPLEDSRKDPGKRIQREKSRRDADDESSLFSSKVTASAKSSPRSENRLIKAVSGIVGGGKSNDIDYDRIPNDQFKLERKWRQWVDDKFVHTLAPNIYQSITESINSFKWFSQAGEWEKIFPWYQRFFVIYGGALAMYAFSGKLKRKYNLKPNVRESFYDCANEWCKAVGKKQFLGGVRPNLADISCYGILTSIKGTQAFEDLLNNTDIQPWFERMTQIVEQQEIFSLFCAFFWLLSLLVSSMLWFAVVPLRSELAFAVPFSVIFQEFFRYLFYLVIKRAETALQSVRLQELAEKGMIFDRFAVAYASGYGYGLISGAFAIVNVLSDMAGPGTIGISGHSQDFFLATAFLTLVIILLHTCWGVVMFTSLDKIGIHRFAGPIVVLLAHMLFSCLTLSNRSKTPTYAISLVAGYVLLLVMIFYTFALKGITFNSFRRTLTNHRRTTTSLR
ncbi:unnamed protein product [Didymodactylos carnosus]|uniref:Glutaredoxin domain-containing protein n=1 Tax=Didymodactylos carnosus TaxID=1234261 RepID=A0A813UHI3_9BILA|nr:unnamed protein product [Didymodactylos carnosus]CAF3616271.1 unnamed protein product [Didymodactylos carnosus]